MNATSQELTVLEDMVLALKGLVDRDAAYWDAEIRIGAESHSHARLLMREARSALARAERYMANSQPARAALLKAGG